MPEKLKLVSWRDILFIALPSLLLAGAAFWLAAQFIKPAPPDRLLISTGGEAGAYQRFAARYKDVLARYGVELVTLPSAGAIEQAGGLGEGLGGLGLGAGGADLLDGGAQLAPLSLVAGRANLRLAHALLGGLDAGHSGPL